MLFQNKKLNKLLVGAIVVGLAVPLLNVLLIYPDFRSQITNGIEQSAIRLAKHLEDELHKGGDWFSILKGRRLTPKGQAMVDSYLSDFNLSKLKIFSKAGIAVYSTDEEDIGAKNIHTYFVDHVAKGEVFSTVVKKETNSLEGQIYEEDIVEVYVPFLDGQGFSGAFELYYNVTEQMAALEKQTFYATSLSFAVSFYLLFALYWGFRNLDVSLREKQLAEAEVKALQGIIPICMHCKGIRDDKGSWNQLEAYIELRSDAQFSHGLCESCLEEHYGKEIADSVKNQSA